MLKKRELIFGAIMKELPFISFLSLYGSLKQISLSSDFLK